MPCRPLAAMLLLVLSGCGLMDEETVEIAEPERYCYRTLAEIDCYTAPDPRASAQTRVP